MSEKKKVLLDSYFRTLDEIFEPCDLKRLYDMADIVWGRDEKMPEEEIDKVRGELFAIITGNWRHGDVNDYPVLGAILEAGGGHPSPKVLDYKSCFARGIRVLSCAPAFGPMVAEMALAMALCGLREIVECHNGFSRGDELYYQAGKSGISTLFDETVGFIGFGSLARNLKPLIEPFRCKIHAYDPWLPETFLKRQGVIPTSLDELMAKSKVIFVLAIPSEENKGMIDRRLLELIQKDAVFVLISRAHLVDFDALTELVSEGRFKAAIDVFPEEPVPKDHPIRKAKGTVLSGHRAADVRKGLRLIGRMIADDLEAILAGIVPTEMQIAQPEFIKARGTPHHI